jgi:hypothetical protein
MSKTLEEAEYKKLKEEEQTLEEAKAEQLHRSHLKEDNGEAMDLELFHSNRGIPPSIIANILDHFTILTMTAKTLKDSPQIA